MKHRIIRFRREGSQFRREFRRQIRLLIIVTLGFTIAFTWRQTIFDVFENLVVIITDIRNSAALSILTSLLITLLSILIVFLTSHFLKNGPDH